MPNGGRGNRWMYQMTGLPGWMRLGFSPGWQGRSPTGMGPCATYMTTGQWPTPQAQAYWQAGPTGTAFSPGYGIPGAPPAAQMTPEAELDFLKNQAGAVKSQLERISARISELEAEGS